MEMMCVGAHSAPLRRASVWLHTSMAPGHLWGWLDPSVSAANSSGMNLLLTRDSFDRQFADFLELGNRGLQVRQLLFEDFEPFVDLFGEHGDLLVAVSIVKSEIVGNLS